MAGKTFDPKKYSVIVGTVPIRGLDSDSMVKVARDVPELYKDYTDAYGVVTRFKTSNNVCTVTLTLSQSSTGNDVLSNWMQLDKQADAGKFPLTIQDFNGKTLFFAAEAYVFQPPEVDGGQENKTRTWLLKAIDMDMYIGGIQ